MANYFKQIFKDNLLYDGIYIEPYAGGASVALSLLFNEYASKVIINDIDKSIFSFWHSVLNETDNLCKLIRDTPVSVDTWDIQRFIQNNTEDFDLLTLGFATFFLNRTNRSGILKAGIIGGRDQNGKWNIDARYNKPDLIKRIEKIAFNRNKIELFNLDAGCLVSALKATLPSKSLFYFDPPYFVKGKDLYLNFYNENDHQIMADTISKIKKQRWVVTYDCVSSIKKLYNKFRQKKYSLNYSAGERSKGEELMIFSDNLYMRNPDRFI